MRRETIISKLCLFLCLSLAGLSLTACGFKPLYSERTLAVERSASILIMPVTETSGNFRAGQILHNFLRDRLNPTGMPSDPDYRLIVSFSKTVGSLTAEVGEETQRKYLEVRGTYKLINNKNDRELYTSDIISRVHYDVFAKRYDSRPAASAAEQNVLSQVADDIARAITLRLAKI